jgi:hypothetical protein
VKEYSSGQLINIVGAVSIQLAAPFLLGVQRGMINAGEADSPRQIQKIRNTRQGLDGLQLVLGAEDGGGVAENKLLDQAGRNERNTHVEDLLLNH